MTSHAGFIASPMVSPARGDQMRALIDRAIRHHHEPAKHRAENAGQKIYLQSMLKHPVSSASGPRARADLPRDGPPLFRRSSKAKSNAYLTARGRSRAKRSDFSQATSARKSSLPRRSTMRSTTCSKPRHRARLTEKGRDRIAPLAYMRVARSRAPSSFSTRRKTPRPSK